MSLHSNELTLIDMALAAQKKAYVPYSNFKVGAAFMDRTGRMFAGCNVENASYGLTVCAERVAIFSAVVQGVQSIDTIAIVTDGNGLGSPCGACLQVIQEFGPGAKIILAKEHSRYKTFYLNELLPHPFNLISEVRS